MKWKLGSDKVRLGKPNLTCDINMGNILGGDSNNALGSFGGQDSSSGCCDPKVDLISLLVTIGAIGAISAFLRQGMIDNNIMGRRKRRSYVWQGIKRKLEIR